MLDQNYSNQIRNGRSCMLFTLPFAFLAMLSKNTEGKIGNQIALNALPQATKIKESVEEIGRCVCVYMQVSFCNKSNTYDDCTAINNTFTGLVFVFFLLLPK